MTTANPENEPLADEAVAGSSAPAQPEPVTGAAPEDSSGAALADLSGDELADTISSELAERTADLQRLTAEYANYRRRVERDRKSAIDGAKAAMAAELLPVLDDLDRARAHGDLESGPLKSVADKLVDALRKTGLEEFGVTGEPFDPTLHEAVQHEGDGHNQVLGVVMRKGYRFGERVLRPALVGVTDAVTDSAGQPDSSNAGNRAGAGEQ